MWNYKGYYYLPLFSWCILEIMLLLCKEHIAGLYWINWHICPLRETVNCEKVDDKLAVFMDLYLIQYCVWHHLTLLNLRLIGIVIPSIVLFKGSMAFTTIIGCIDIIDFSRSTFPSSVAKVYWVICFSSFSIFHSISSHNLIVCL